MTPLMEAKSLTKHYGPTIALESVSFQVDGGVTGLLGPNGAGKSTAIKLFLGLIDPTSGSAEVMGERPDESLEIRGRLGYMPEHNCLPRSMTASEFLTHMGPGERAPSRLRQDARGRHAASRRARRGALQADRRILHRHGAEGQARPGPGP